MNIRVLPWSNTETPDVSDDDPARRKVTVFSKSGIRGSYKCPLQDGKQDQVIEYGFYEGNIEVEVPIEMVQTKVCNTLIMLLEQSNNPSRLIENILVNK